jgi:hypothetical protein
MLTFHNNTMWAIKFGYKVTLSCEGAINAAKSSSKASKTTTQEVDILLARKRKLTALLDRGNFLFQSFLAVGNDACMIDGREVDCPSNTVEGYLTYVDGPKSTVESILGAKKLYQLQNCEKQLKLLEEQSEKVKLLLSFDRNNQANSSTMATSTMPTAVNYKAATTGSGEAETNMEGSAVNSTQIASESVIVRAADEIRFRLPLPLIADDKSETASQEFLLSYEFTLPHSRQRGLDVGFAICQEMADGSLPQVVPYKRIGAAGVSNQVIISQQRDHRNNKNNRSHNIVLIFDNSYSYFQTKEIRYRASLKQVTSPILNFFSSSTNDGDVHLSSLDSSPIDSISAPLDKPDGSEDLRRTLLIGTKTSDSTLTSEKITALLSKRKETLQLAREISILLDEGVLLTAKRKGE